MTAPASGSSGNNGGCLLGLAIGGLLVLLVGMWIIGEKNGMNRPVAKRDTYCQDYGSREYRGAQDEAALREYMRRCM